MIYLISLVFIIGYFVLIKRLEYGWDSISTIKKDSFDEKISVVVAFRNESENIVSICNQILNQDFKNKYEIIFVDDHSQDDGYSKLEKIKNITLLQSEGRGKKDAIKKGVDYASGSVIVTTDADCIVKPNWLTSIVAPFNDESIKMVVGPVVLLNNLNSLFGNLQVLEFSTLIGSGAGAIFINKAFMCNGANLAFRKEVFQSTKTKVASGDDVFLLHHIKRNKGKIFFVKNQNSIVSTPIKQNVSSFVNQRLRWSAKSTSYTDKDAVIISLLVFVVNFLIILSFFLQEYNSGFTLLLIKLIADFTFVKKIAAFFNIKKWSLYFLFLQLVYPFYIVYIAIVSQFKNYSWKGRILKK